VCGVLNTDHRVKVALRSESVRPWHEVEHEFNESEYRAVRDRQMKELELEDDLLNKVPVRYVTGHFLSQDSHRLKRENPRLETCAPSCTKNHMSLFDNSVSNVSSKVPGL
jgi:hypothetical protein